MVHFLFLLLKEGGWWTVHEMFKHLAVDVNDKNGRRVINSVVSSMTRCQQIEQRYTEQPRAQYAVLPGCKIPIGLTVGEVQL